MVIFSHFFLVPSYPGVNITAVSPTILFSQCVGGLVTQKGSEPELEPEEEMELGLILEEGVESVCGEDGRWSPDPSLINCTSHASATENTTGW